MTIAEVENFLNETEDVARSLVDPWELDGETLFDPETLLDTILMKGGQLTPLYTNIATFYRMNRSWWNRHKLTFQKWWDVIDDEYTPLWDRDGFEETTDQTTDDGGTTGTRTSTEVMDDDTTKNSTTKEVIDDDTTGSLTSQTIIDNDTTGSLTGREVIDTDTTETSAKTEVMDDDTTSTSSDTKNVTGSSNTSTAHNVSAFDSEWVTDPVTGNLVPQYQPEWIENENKTYTEGTTDTVTGSSTDDRTTTTNENSSGTVDTTVSNTESTTGTSDTQTDVTQSTTGTDDRTTDTTYSETGTDDRTTTFNEQTAGTSENTRDYTHQHHSWGNWGISTTAQKLLEQELRIRAFDIYEHMADFFLDELAVRVFI